ncbi:UNVERIFIED_CONTAM: hypothetical protein N8J90_14805 [Halobacillus marinus]|uniref:hypothetical protein n=1 Tax=Bacillus sp. SB49 TaxID=1071080 RepID=UPI0003F829B8|nr:hypothetical protein [Bacillus sp. SB49]QHT47902.1 hypothetical protein M662_15900 [Bacillus sp. SB49]
MYASDGLLKSYNHKETPPSLLIPLQTTGVETGLQVPVSLERLCLSNQIELIATANWLITLGGAAVLTAYLPITAEPLTTLESTVNVMVEAPVTFNVYRDEELIFTTTDFRTLMFRARVPGAVTSTTESISLSQIDLTPVSTSNGLPSAATTTFQYIDTNTTAVKHVYTITAQLGRYSPVPMVNSLRTTDTTTPLIPVNFTITSFQPIALISYTNFSGKVIRKQDPCRKRNGQNERL